MLVAVDEAGHGAHALGVDDAQSLRGSPRPAATDAILPPRTTIVPESITWPLPTMMRAFVMATSCAATTRGAINEAASRHAHSELSLHRPHLVDGVVRLSTTTLPSFSTTFVFSIS